jgi:hypothetical protein
MPRQELTTATQLLALTPSDSTDLPVSIKGIYVGTTGNIAMIAAEDTAEVILPNVPAGYYPIAPKRIFSTNTTASNIVGLI